MATDPWAVVNVKPTGPVPIVPKNQPKPKAHQDPWAVVSVKPAAPPQPEKPSEQSSGLHPHTDATVQAWSPSWFDRTRRSLTTSQPFHALETYAPGVASALHLTPTDVSGTEEYFTHKGQLVGLENLTQGAFRKNPWDKPGRAENISTGVAKGVSGLTTPDNLLLMTVPIGDVLGLGGGLARAVLPRMLSAGFSVQMLKGLYDQSKEWRQAKDTGDKDAADQIAGEMSVTALMVSLSGYHATRGTIDTLRDAGTNKTFNEHAQKAYKSDYKDLSDPQKATVIYNVAADSASPREQARIDREAKRIGKVAKKADIPSVEDVTKDYEARAEAARTVTEQILVRHQREAAYHHEVTQREAVARQEIERKVTAAREQGEKDRAAAEREAEVETPAVPVEEGRSGQTTRGLKQTSERESGQRYDPESTGPAIPVTDRRAAAQEPLPEPGPEVVAAEAKVQELTEGRMGVSFSALPLSRQIVAARWMERFHPEVWTAFHGTPANDAFRSSIEHAARADAAMKTWLDRHPTGSGEPAAPGADVHAGLAKLILARTNIDAALKADPATHKDLNEHTEKSMGKSWDSLAPEDRPAALAEYFRQKPEGWTPFLTQDIIERIQSGQHIDLANIEATLADRQQVQVLMAERDGIRQQMDAGIASQMAADAAKQRQAEMVGLMTQAQAPEGPRNLQPIVDATAGLTQDAIDLGLGPVDGMDDLFRIEKAVKETKNDLRTPKMRGFAARMQHVRAVASEHVARTLAEDTAAAFHVDIEGARDKAAKQVIQFTTEAHDQQDAANTLRAGGKTAEAEAAQTAAADAQRKADAVVAGAQSVANPPPPSLAVTPAYPMSIGGATRVVSPQNAEGIPAHYVVMEATDAQTSHMPMTYDYRPGYNQNGQPRNYKTDKQAQTGVEERVSNLDLDQVLSNGVTTMEGPGIIDQRGHVISGNGRTLSILTALIKNPKEYMRYREELALRAQSLGVDPVELDKYRNPILMKRLDAPLDEHQWSMLGLDLNRPPAYGINEVEMGAAMSRLLTTEYLGRLDNIVSSMPSTEVDKNGRTHTLTARQAMTARSIDIADLMVDSGIIAPNQLAEYVIQEGSGKGELKPKAKDLFENMLVGLTVSDSTALEGASSSTKNNLARAGIFFVKMKNAGENWNLASMNSDAVRLVTRMEDASAALSYLQGRPEETAKGTGTESLVEKGLHPERYQDRRGHGTQTALDITDFDGQALHAPVHAGVEALAMALEESPAKYTEMLAKYSDRATGTQVTMFGAEHPADVFTAEIASEYGLNVIPEEWGRVVGLSDTVKEQIEATRGELPVEVSVSQETAVADVTPDSSSVEVALPEGPRTVADLRRALESHPGLSPEEAVAVGTMMQDILPRALGVELNTLLGNRRLTIAFGGKEKDGQRGYTEMLEDGRAIIRLCDTADTSTFIHEMAHYVRQYLNPGDQAIANKFVGAKPGEGWTTKQEETFAQAFERYHYDGGIRRGKLEKVFATLSRAMQSVYNAVTAKRLAKSTPELNTMFDNWYDWTRAERKPLTAMNDLDKLGKVEIPKNVKTIEWSGKEIKGDAQTLVFMTRKEAADFVKDKKNKVVAWRTYSVPGEEAAYVMAQVQGKKKLYQSDLSQLAEHARHAKALEEELRREKDPRRQALLRGQLNGIEDKLRGATGLVSASKPEPPDTSIIQLVHGISEMPTQSEPTTPAQAMTVQQVMGDPTAIALGGEYARPGAISDGPSADGQEGVRQVHGGAGSANGEHAPVKGGRTAKSGSIAKPATTPLSKVKAAKLQEPTVPRGTPVVDPDKWRGHVTALGLPEGTPPPTQRIASELRDLLIFPGQPEVADGVVSALQQYDATILASPAGSGKNYLLSAVASHLLGTGGDKTGLWVTRSQNLIHDAGNMKDVARRFGVDVDDLPGNVNDIQTGMYAATYAGLRGNRAVLRVPWDFVLFDESSEAVNWTESEQGKAVVLLGHAAKKVVYSSATPYSTTLEIGYMHKLGLWPHGGFTGWASQFGLVESGPNSYSGGSAPRKLEKLRQQLVERGQWQQLYKDMEGTEAHVVLIPQTEDVRAGVQSIRKAFTMARSAFQRNKMSSLIKAAAGHEAIYLKRYLEAAKLPHAIEQAKKAIEAGWAPVIFTEYRSPADEGMEFFNRLPGDLGQQINAMLPPLPDIVKEMRKGFGDKVGIFAGAANQLRTEELDSFQGGEKDALYATYAAGGVGASAHDLVGDRPRMGIFISLPWGSKMLEQATSRTDRYGRQSGVANIFLTTDALPEIKLLGTKVLPRMRALKAAVYGEKNESQLSKNLREAAGIPAELIEYEQGQEYEPQTADFERTTDEAKFTPITEFELPDAKKAMNKPMKYKGQGKKLYQGPADEDPEEALRRAAVNDAWQELLGRTKKLPAAQESVLTANEGAIKAEAAKAGRQARTAGEDVKEAVGRTMRDKENEALIWLDELKQEGHAATHFVKSSMWMFGMSGDRAVEQICKDAGMGKEGAELKRRMIDYDLRSGNYRGELGGMIEKIMFDHKLKPADLKLVSKVVEGQATTNDPRIQKAVADFRKFTAYTRKRMANAGMAVVFYDDKGKRSEFPYSKIADDPKYWPRIYNWEEKFVVDGTKGERIVTSLGDIMRMPTGSERREMLIEKVALQRGISKVKAQLFFDKNARGIRLAGNVERSREFEIPMYGRDRKALDRYVNEVAEKLAATEVHGQFREKTDPLIDRLPNERTRKLVNHIITADLDPARLHDSDRFMLRQVNRWLVLSKMSLSALKLPFHMAKTALTTNTRSVALSFLKGVTSPRELRRDAIDSGAMVNYIKQAWMREYGMRTGGLDQKMLEFNGFTAILNFSRVIAAGAGRLWFEKYAYPELVKNPKNLPLRRKLTDLYGMTDEHMDNLVANGYGPADVKRVELGAANWTTGSGRPSELPPALRGTLSDDPIMQRLTTIMRISQSLHGFMFKTANLVNRTVWHELYKSDFKTAAPYQLIARFTANFGIAGWALGELLHLRHQMAGSPEADIEKRRKEWIAEHPVSGEALFNAMSDLSMGMGIEVLTQFFNELATHDPKDKAKLIQQERVINAASDLFIGVAARDGYNTVKAVKDWQATFEDTGPHKLTPEERRSNIVKQLANEDLPLTRLAVKPTKAPPPAFPSRHRHVTSRLQ